MKSIETRQLEAAKAVIKVIRSPKPVIQAETNFRLGRYEVEAALKVTRRD